MSHSGVYYLVSPNVTVRFQNLFAFRDKIFRAKLIRF